MAGRATEPSSALPARLNCCCKTVDLKWGEISGKGMPTALAPGSVGMVALPPCCAASLAGAHSPFNFSLAAALFLGDLLLWRHGVFQHGGLLIPLQSKVVFALFLERERENDTPKPSSPPTAQTPYRVTGSPCLVSSFPSSTVRQWLFGGSWKAHPVPLSGEGLSVPFSAQPHLFEDDIDVASNQLGDLFPLRRLHRVVTILVISKILQRQGTG